MVTGCPSHFGISCSLTVLCHNICCELRSLAQCIVVVFVFVVAFVFDSMGLLRAPLAGPLGLLRVLLAGPIAQACACVFRHPIPSVHPLNRLGFPRLYFFGKFIPC